ncbi:hypothetical protein HBI24_160120 [Parastagonospora nodorum]|nr:hypothetical protein HBH96_164160 [Parastagonospora nodorum]KAH5578915.1 hypothetical protein HBI24_160120 [Parastagonospora nodorum]
MTAAACLRTTSGRFRSGACGTRPSSILSFTSSQRQSWALARSLILSLAAHSLLFHASDTMPPRKSMVPSSKRRLESESESVDRSVTSDIATPDPASKKRKIDWATIDQKKVFPGFKLYPAKIKTPKANRKQKMRKSTGGIPTTGDTGGYNKDDPLDADIVQKNPFSESQLSETHYVVRPAAEWESTQRYRKFTISEAEFQVGQTVFVSKTEEEQDASSAIKDWIGKVLEVRAGDAAHVYLRVYWLYRPEDLPDGRQPHHADGELIASNHMDIIEALSVIDRATVIHWDEDLEKSMPFKDQLFWRQTFDVGKPKGKQLSKLRSMCIDKAPCNPDEGVVQCPSCSKWLHSRCLEERAVADAQANNKTKGPRKSSSTDVDFSATLTTLGELGPTYLTVTDHRPKQEPKHFNVDIKCLICNALIEGAADDLPPENVAYDPIILPSREAAPAKLEDADSVIGKDENTPAPASPAAAPVKRGRGRPRKYPRPSLGEAPAELVESSIDMTEAVFKPEDQTPAAALVSKSVFQSGFRSIKRLLWRTEAV